MFTFLDFLAEMEQPGTDPEDLSSEELNARAQEMRKRAQLKSSGRGDQANKLAMRDLQVKQRESRDPRQRADYARRIKELQTAENEPQAGI